MRELFPSLRFALVLVRNEGGKYLAVNQSKGRGWWIPGGGVEVKETFQEGAVREVKQEAGIDVSLKGILSFQSYFKGDFLWQRMTFYGEPKNPHQNPKNYADQESQGAEWVTLDQFSKKDKLRGPQLLQFAERFEKGKMMPLDFLQEF